jgi:fatty acid desaturase
MHMKGKETKKKNETNKETNKRLMAKTVYAALIYIYLICALMLFFFWGGVCYMCVYTCITT